MLHQVPLALLQELDPFLELRVHLLKLHRVSGLAVRPGRAHLRVIFPAVGFFLFQSADLPFDVRVFVKQLRKQYICNRVLVRVLVADFAHASEDVF